MRRLSRISRSNLELPDVTVLKSGNSKFDLEMRESPHFRINNIHLKD